MMASFLLYGSIVGLIALSAFFSGSETGFYRLSRFRLRLGVEQKRPFFRTLSNLIREGQSLVMAILIGNNLVNYLLTSIVTLIFFRRLSDQRLAELYTTVLVTPILFVFGEMIPKILFYHWADILIPRLTWLLWFSHKVFTLTGAVAALRWLSDRITRLFHLSSDTATAVDATQRHQVSQIIHETREEGLLSDVQREMIERLLKIPNVLLQSLMIPIRDVEKIVVQTNRSMLLKHLAETVHALQPVFLPGGEVIGYVSIYDVLGGEQEFSDLRSFVRPIVPLAPTCSAIDAMNTLCRKREKIALIQSPQSKQPLGIITLTDLVEELTGELSAS
jgi:CBS domain containing-hemolysin-like protein